jgi:hypothetical protein
MYRIIFRRIADYIQSIHESKSERGDGGCMQGAKEFYKEHK